MPCVTIIQVIYNSKRFIEPVFEAIFKQTFKDFNVVAVIAGNNDGGKELLMQKFPQVEIIDPGYNIGFATGHNLVFAELTSDFFQLVNPDMIMEPNYIEQVLKAFDDPKVGAATGKLYQFKDLGLKIEDFRANKILDTTGVVIGKSGRARDRGQHEADNGQYDSLTLVDAVSGAGCMYRAAALQAIRCRKIGVSENRSSAELQSSPPSQGGVPAAAPNRTVQGAVGGGGWSYEYFDEDFHSYWEDVDLSWRMSNAGWKNIFVPSAIGYHGRGAGSSEGGYQHIVSFIKHHRALNPRIRQLNYKNHIFLYIKNSPYFYPQFFIREFFMLCYILLFEISTLKVLPDFFMQLPKMWQKRKYKMHIAKIK